MQRRSFLRGLAASAGAAALPMPIPAKPFVAVAKTSGVASFHYGWACVFAQKNKGITPADIAEKFGVSPSQANSLFERMLDRGVLHPPGLDGRSHTTRPWQPWDQKQSLLKANQKARQQEQGSSDRLHKAFQAMMASITDGANGVIDAT